MRHKATALVLIAALCSIMLIPATPAQAQAGNPHSSALTLPISGTATDPTSGAVNNVTGTLTINRFANQGGNLMALGTLVATVTDTATGAVRNIVTSVAVPVTIDPASSCPILNLTLGPLHLNLLGLVVDLNQVVLNITAVPGAGNLLGNLLCAVANLLNGGGLSAALNQIVSLLNQILAAL
jgi:hypothetical protein